MIKRHDVIPENMYNRAVRGQHMYTPVVVVRTGDHAHIYVAGQTSVLPDGGIGGTGDMGAQIRIVCEKVQQALASVGAALDDVVRTVTYTLDIEEYYRGVDERYKIFNNLLPTNTLLGVSRLAHPDMLVEIEAEAIVDPDRVRIP
jgi:enamine deaminase RidA (YjgF/YER057c/UK114 family)